MKITSHTVTAGIEAARAVHAALTSAEARAAVNAVRSLVASTRTTPALAEGATA